MMRAMLVLVIVAALISESAAQTACKAGSAPMQVANGTECIECAFGTYSAIGEACVECASARRVGATTCPNKQPPVVSPNFSVDTNEVDGTGDDETTLTTIVQQTIAQDIDLRRSNMIAKGSLVNGALQQVKRCDLSPSAGWFVQASGVKVNSPESWSCTNTTIDVVSEQPANCEYNSFWTFGRDMKYEGVVKMNGVNSDKWTYYQGDGSKSQYAFWMKQDEAVPVATGRVTNPSSPSSLYTIFFKNFQSTPPPESFYYPEQGVSCPESTLPSDDNASVANVVSFPESLAHMHELAGARQQH